MSGYKYTSLINNKLLNDTGDGVVDTGNGELVTSTGTVGGTLPTYEEFFTKYYNTMVKNANQEYEQQIANSERQREKQILSAGNDYNSSVAASGANAAALSAMGLSQGGYSKYLDSQAYAQKQAATNYAYQNEQSAVNNAQTIKNTALQNADSMYLSYLQQLEANKEAAYEKIYTNLSTLSFADIERLGASKGLDKTTIESLKEAKDAQTYAALLGTEYTLTDLDNLVATGQLNKDMVNYTKLVDGVKKYTSNDINFLNKDGTNMTYLEAKDHLDAIENSGAADPGVVEALKKKFEEEYTAITADATIVNQKNNAGKDKKNFKVKIGSTEYKVQYNGNKLSDEDKYVAKELKGGTVFEFRGLLYVKMSDGTCYQIEGRNNDDDYKALKKKFKTADEKKSHQEAISTLQELLKAKSEGDQETVDALVKKIGKIKTV